MPNIPKTEVLVVGAGPVGMLTALLLTRHGVPTRIIDQESRTAAHSYACVLHSASLDLLERVDLADEVTQLGRRVKMASIFAGHERRAELDFSRLPGRYPCIVVLDQSMLENLLEQRLRKAGCKIEWNRRLLKIKPRDNGLEAWIENLELFERDYSLPMFANAVGERITLEADFVIGADGHHSAVRQQMDIRAVPMGAPQLFAVYELETVEPVDHVMKLVLNKSGISALWPVAENKCRWSFQIVPPRAQSRYPRKDREPLISIRERRALDSTDDLGDFLAKRAPWFPARSFREMNWIAYVQFERQMASKFGQGRCWLAGDSAHQTSPAGMQSMNRGLLEGADLADRIKSILRREAGMEALQIYDRVHGEEWKRLLGLDDLTERSHTFSSWARRHFASIFGAEDQGHPPRSFPSWARPYFGSILQSLPATGDDLNHLLKQF
ncbi:MAG: FAD-dependent monooxygenase [Limisphaerales bacterium]